MQVVIFCGGQGTRIRDVADDIPKPMIPIGERPILWHIMKGYARHGFTDFILCLGYKGWAIKRYFLDYHLAGDDFTVRLGDGEIVDVHERRSTEPWSVTLAETGLDCMTGARLKRIEKHIRDDSFMASYGDGVADVDIRELLDFHRGHGRIATLTAVRPPSRFGELEIDGSRVLEFTEKPTLAPGWINGGFFVFHRSIFERLGNDAELALEREPLMELARDGELMAFHHGGFWQPMDNSRDYGHLNELWSAGRAPWKTWNDDKAPPRYKEPPAPDNRSNMPDTAALRLVRPDVIDHGSFWRDRRVFVTGCTGLVGSWTVRQLLEQGAHVVGLIRDQAPGSELYRAELIGRIDVVHGELEDYVVVERALAEYEIQTVIHLAAQTIVGIANQAPLSTFEANIRGTWHLLEAARRCGGCQQIIVASSDKAYGEQASLPYTEDAPLQGRHPYDVSKSCADLIALSYHHTFDLPVCVTRCGNFFGGGDLNWNRLVPGTVRSVLRGQRPILRSDGSLIRDYLYVKDGAAAYLHLAECMARTPELAGQAFNFSCEARLTALEMVQRVLRAMGSNLAPDIRNETRHEIINQYLSAAKARDLLAWQPRYHLDQALAETIDWYRDYFSASGEQRRVAA